MNIKKSNQELTQQVPPRAMVMGDPERVMLATRHLSKPQDVWNTRNYVAVKGQYQDSEVIVCSHGVGSSGASLVFDRLLRSGTKSILRVGTCGGLTPKTPPDSLVIVTGAIRDDGTSSLLVPIEYPAIADIEIIIALQEAAKQHPSTVVTTGLVWSSGIFYQSPVMPQRMELWTDTGAIAVEMEMATLLVMAGLYGASAGGILTVEGGADKNLDPWSGRVESRAMQAAVNTMIEIGFQALCSVSRFKYPG